ncbi:MAG: hypothetical protein Q9162_003396 [Coniocarpon cinnabarinum]
MPLIEELPTAKAANATPGWAYVPDTGYDPSKAPIVPSGARNRGRKANAASSNEITARQQHKIDQHLALLDRENHRDVQIAVPNRPRDVAARGRCSELDCTIIHSAYSSAGLRNHMTPGVRKILLSQKTFANHLADEEAAIALREEEAAARQTAKPASAKSKKAPTARHSISDVNDVEMVDVPQDSSVMEHANEVPSADTVHPLLRVNMPKMPSREEIETLLATPPLSYNAARAAPSSSTAPPRQFCEICGYWGRVRCMKCGGRVCGLDCQRQHEDTSCQKFWA